MTQANDICQQLGERAVLLNQYISCLLEAANRALAYSASEDGFNTALELRKICRDIILWEERYINHPFYVHAKSYIKSQPIDCQDVAVKEVLYIAALSHDFLEEQERSLSGILDHAELHKLYSQTCDIIGSER